ncbi:aminopeptidase [Candidatus Bathyarchaeota archaeon]|nr:aminopeptidase [Candidatus Bathyarchaeota archaeon]
MFRVNMGVKNGEKLLIVTDLPTQEEWEKLNSEKLTDALRRSLLAKIVSEIARKKFPNCTVEFYTYPSVGRHGAEPGEEVEEKMKMADVVIAITSYSLSHTNAREEACKAGARIASMPNFLPEMFYSGGPMAADYEKIAEETKKIAKLLTAANEAVVRSKQGTDVMFSVKGREGGLDMGIYTERGAWGNLPSGEAYVAPVEGTSRGKVVVEKGWYPNLKENMILVFKNGKVVDVIGGGDVGETFRALLSPGREEEPYISRRNLAELGVGTNPHAKRPDNVLEAEKIRGTVHVAVGDSSHLGGTVAADLHEDFIIPHPDLILDGKTVMKNGELLI